MILNNNDGPGGESIFIRTSTIVRVTLGEKIKGWFWAVGVFPFIPKPKIGREGDPVYKLFEVSERAGENPLK